MAHETDDVNRLQRSRSSLWIAATLIPLGMILVSLTALVLAAEGAPSLWMCGGPGSFLTHLIPELYPSR